MSIKPKEQEKNTQLDKDEDIESNQEHSIEVSLQTVEENQPDDTNTSNVETEPHHPQYDMKQQLEDAIATILLPKLEEMRDSSLHRDEREIAAVAEETIERFLRHMEMKNAPPNGEILPGTENENDALMWRYLQDHKQNILMRFARKMNPEMPTQNGSVLKDAETMTEGNTDSDVESLHSLSSSLRSSTRTRDRTPLSERVRNLSPESLREALNHGSSSEPGAKASRKDEMIAKAYVDATFSQLLETTVKEQDQEFSTEVNFTTVDGESSTNHQRKDSNTSESSEEAKDDNIVDDNWVVPKISPKLR
uniref:Uncharacterized protein n=1 Tax=Ciona savignyi TaxID=51511 RepID=H2YU15_CIOSA